MDLLFISHDRSGSNMSRAMLNQHPNIYIIPALPLYDIFYYYMDMYEDLLLEENWRSFVSDLLQFYNANPYPIPTKINFEDINSSLLESNRNLSSALEIILRKIVPTKKNRITVSAILSLFSSKQLIRGFKFGSNIKLIKPFIEQTKFTHAIFQYRDPRDVALSTYKAGINPIEPLDFVKEWADWHQEVRSVLKNKKTITLELKYEDVIYNAQQEFLKVFNFLKIRPCNANEFYKDPEIKNIPSSHMWENISKPVMVNNYEKFYSAWDYVYVNKMDEILGDTLKDFGYNFCDKNKFAKEIQPVHRVLHKQETRVTHIKQAELYKKLVSCFISYKKGKFNITDCNGNGVLNYEDKTYV